MAYLCNDDILSLIFIDALQNYTSSLSILRSVSRTWFDVAGRTPQLWTKLFLKRRSDFIDLEYPQFYLPKSGALPIEVYIWLPDSVDVDDIGGVTALLRNHASRFRSLELYVRSHEELEALISSIGGSKPAPFLEKLVLRVREGTESSNASEFLCLSTAFTPSPRLARISLSRCPFPKTFPPTITSLAIYQTDAVNKIISSFESTPSLQDFTFAPSSLYYIDPEFENPDIVSLPHLLTAKVSVPGYGAYLLCAIDAPKLNRIHLDGHGKDYWPQEGGWEVDVTSALFSTTIRHLSARSRNLRQMTLDYTEFDSPLEDYTLLLSGAGFPQLEKLTLNETDIDDEALLAAGNGGGSSSLKELTLRRCWDVTGRGLLGFVRGRRSDFRLYLSGCERVRQEDIVALSAVIKVHRFR